MIDLSLNGFNGRAKLVFAVVGALYCQTVARGSQRNERSEFGVPPSGGISDIETLRLKAQPCFAE